MSRCFPALLCAALLICGAAPVSAQAPAATAAPAKAEACFGCHGEAGNSTDGDYPILAGQNARYIYLQLKDFKESRRNDPQMTPMVADLSREDMQELANWFAAQKPKPTGFKADGAKVAAGQKKSDEVLCPMCHLGAFVGQNEIPRAAGQQYAYVVKQLQDFKARRRTNDAGNMTSVAGTLSDADIENLAQYIANLQ
jgi:cytochrome c553